MIKATQNNTFKRLRNRYRLVVMNDDTYEEVVTFKLSRLSVYIGMSIVFVMLVGLTVALLTFTNLKFLIPGFGKQGSLSELRNLKVKTDSLEQSLFLQQQYLNGIKKALGGGGEAITDTTVLKLPKVDSLSE